MKSNKLKRLVPLILLAVLLAGCASTYYDRFGGFPLDTEEFIIKHDKILIKLQVTYRYPYQAAELDTNFINIAVKTVVDKRDLKQLYIQRLVLAAVDNSYLYSYPNPAIYDTYGKYPLNSIYTDPKTGISIASSDQPSLFTVNRFATDYNIYLYYQILNSQGEPENFEYVAPIIVSKVRYNIPTTNTPIP